MVTRRLALRWRKRRAIEASPVSFAASSRYSLIPGHVDVGNEIVRIGTLEHEHLDGVVGLGPLNEGDQIADQFGPQKIHGRGRNFREQNGPFLAHGERLENHGITSALGGLMRFASTKGLPAARALRAPPSILQPI